MLKRFNDFVLLLIAVLVLHLISMNNFIALHTAIEFLGICIAFVVFVIAWNSHEFSENNYLILIGIPFIYAALFDLLHIFYYKGIGIFNIPGDLSTKFLFWGRIIVSSAYLCAFIFAGMNKRKKINKNFVFAIFGIMTGIIYYIIVNKHFGIIIWGRDKGVTEHGKLLGYINIFLFAASFIILFINRRLFDLKILRYFTLSVIFNILSILLTIKSHELQDITLMLSNYSKLISYVFLYEAIVIKAIREPYKFIFKELTESREKLAKQNIILTQFADVDNTTGLFNHRKIIEILENEIQRSKRYESNLSVAMIDIDFFKKINDEYGHLTGDSVLSQLGSVLKSNIRATDYAGRYGGEEFFIIMPETNLPQAYNVGEKIRIAVQEYNFSEDIKITLSVGVAEYAGNSPNELIAESDRKLYESKNNGRNRVSV